MAEELAHSHRLACRRKSKSEVVIQIIQNYLELTWSPKQISNTILKGVIALKLIYHWIYDGTILLGALPH